MLSLYEASGSESGGCIWSMYEAYGNEVENRGQERVHRTQELDGFKGG